MHPRTLATLQELDEAHWFAAVGANDTKAAIILPNWEAAIESCASIDWENLLLEAANQYRNKLMQLSPERFRQWNIIVEDVKKATNPLVERKIAQVVKDHQLPQVFADTVKWDILHLAMEAEYADVYPPGFYASQGYWYRSGHFPCGWEGRFPEGKLVIY